MTVFERPTRCDVAATLAASVHPELHRLEVFESEFTVEIVGRVGSYYLKQLAQESARDAIAGRKIVNRIVVDYSSIAGT
jgi:hypothetical protein